MAQFIDYGSSADGAVSSANGTINSFATCTGTSGAATVTTSLTVAAGDYILLHQSKGTGAGNWEVVKVNSTGTGEFTADRNLTNSYASGAQAVKMPQYSGGTCSNSLTTTAWNGSVGGILALVVNGDYTHSGSLSVAASGFRGGAGVEGSGGSNSGGNQGEGESGTGTVSTSANGIGGGGGGTNSGPTGWGGRAGGGGGYRTAGSNGGAGSAGNGTIGSGGGTIGGTSLTTMFFGGGGGAGGGDNEANPAHGAGGAGGIGGGIVFIIAKSFTLTGTISANGQNGSAPGGITDSSNHASGGGGGAGGSILIKAQTVTLGSTLATSVAGGGGGAPADGGTGGTGGVGQIHVDYLNTVTGTTNPAVDSTQDLTLADIIANLIYGFFM